MDKPLFVDFIYVLLDMDQYFGTVFVLPGVHTLVSQITDGGAAKAWL